MGIYIPNMKLPERGMFPEHFVIDSEGWLYKSHRDAIMNENKIGEVVEVPPHGRLIDFNSIPWENQTMTYDDEWAIKAFDLEQMPTIIEAEEET